MSGSSIQLSNRARFGSFNVTPRAMRSPKRAMTRSQYRETPMGIVVEPPTAHREPVRRGEMVERHDRREAAIEAPVHDCLVVVEGVVGELPSTGSTRAHSTENR